MVDPRFTLNMAIGILIGIVGVVYEFFFRHDLIAVALFTAMGLNFAFWYYYVRRKESQPHGKNKEK